MEFISSRLKANSVKIMVNVAGVSVCGSGVVYETPEVCSYNYILTAKHIFQEDSKTDLDINKIEKLRVFYNKTPGLELLFELSTMKEIEERLIIFDDDCLIIEIDKKKEVSFHPIFVSDKIEKEDSEFISWSILSSNKNELTRCDYRTNDLEKKRLKFFDPPSLDHLTGMSGSGVFLNKRNVLYGIVYRYPDEDFANKTIDCVSLKFKQINEKLKAYGKVQLDTQNSRYKREIKNTVVDIYKATINDVCLNLGVAHSRLKTDILDDWFHDPLRYVDLLNKDYLFKQFEKYFNKNIYKASLAEQFYVPKKKFTLRQALILPFIDRILYMAVVGVLAERLDEAMITTVYSARFNKYSKNQLILNGVEQWKKMQYMLDQIANKKEGNEYVYGCVVEIDLLNFFDNINKG